MATPPSWADWRQREHRCGVGFRQTDEAEKTQYTTTFNGRLATGDIALGRLSSGNTAIWLMKGATRWCLPGGSGRVPTTWSIVGQRDFDGNGTFLDLLWHGHRRQYRDLVHGMARKWPRRRCLWGPPRRPGRSWRAVRIRRRRQGATSYGQDSKRQCRGVAHERLLFDFRIGPGTRQCAAGLVGRR